MTLRHSTKTLLSTIQQSTGKTLQRAMDLGTLIELAETHSQQNTLKDLAFSSKFIVKSFELMKRIGRDGNGYEKISGEFSIQVQKSQQVMKQILAHADAMTSSHFAASYMEMNTLTMENLMQLYHDLSLYKNYLLDQHC